MARIPELEIERLKVEVSLARLVEASGLTLEKRGGDLVCCCPFHEDDTPSFVVTPAKNLFHCFGCGAAGGPIDWVMKRQGVSFRHAVELLREGEPLVGALGQIAGGMTSSSDPYGLSGAAGTALTLSNLYDFRRGGQLDAQVRYGESPAYANYAFGVYAASAGLTLRQALGGANDYAAMRSHLSGRDPVRFEISGHACR